MLWRARSPFGSLRVPVHNSRSCRMSLSLGPVVRTLGLTMACAGALGAQAAQKACEVNEGRPTQVGRALLAVQVATSAQDPAAAARQLSAAVKGLTENGEKMDN